MWIFLRFIVLNISAIFTCIIVYHKIYIPYLDTWVKSLYNQLFIVFLLYLSLIVIIHSSSVSQVKSIFNFSINSKIIITVLVILQKCVLISIKSYIILHSILSNYIVLGDFMALRSVITKINQRTITEKVP